MIFTKNVQILNESASKKDVFEKHGIKNSADGVGFSEKEQKWYGWSHRAIAGFGIGDTVKKGDIVCGQFAGNKKVNVGFTCKTLEDCKKPAEIFAYAVS